jgi:hypothetical protein
VRRIAPDGDTPSPRWREPLPTRDERRRHCRDGRLPTLTTSDKLSGADNPPPGGALVLGADGSLYVSDSFHHAIRRIAPGEDGVIKGAADELITTAGTLEPATGDGGPATAAALRQPFDIGRSRRTIRQRRSRHPCVIEKVVAIHGPAASSRMMKDNDRSSRRDGSE